MRNLASGLFLFLARAIAVMVQLRLVEHWFGASFSGLNVLLNQITYYALIAEMGLSAASLSLLFEPVHKGDSQRVAALLEALRSAIHRMLRIAVPLAALLLALYAVRLRHQIPYVSAFTALFSAALSSFVMLLALPAQSYLNAADRIFEVNLVLGTGFLVQTGLATLLAITTHNYLAVVALFPLIACGQCLVLRTRGRYASQALDPEAYARAAADLRGKARFVLAHRIGGLVYYQSDFLILSLAASLSLVGAYAEYQYLAAGLVGLFTAVSNAVLTRIAREQMRLDWAGRQVLYRRATALFLFSAAGAALLFWASAQDLVQLLFHAAVLRGIVPTLLSVLLFFNLAKAADDLWINAAGAFEIGFSFPAMESLLYIVLGAVLVRRSGAIGIVAAGIATNLVFSVGLRLFVVARGVLHTRIPAVAALRGAAFLQAAILASPLLLLSVLPQTLRAAPRAGLTLALGGAYLVATAPLLIHRLRKDPSATLAAACQPVRGV